MPEEIEEKKEFLEREEIRTMAKDLSRLMEAEAQKEKERIASLKTAEEIKRKGERLEKLGREEEVKKREREQISLERELKEILEEKEPLEIKRNELSKNNAQLEEILRIIIAKEVEIEKKERAIEEKEKSSNLLEEKHEVEKERWNAEEERRKIESERWNQEEELKKNKVQLKETDLKYQQILKREEEIKSSLGQSEEVKETGAEKLEEGKEIKEKETKKVFPETIIPKPLPKKPSSFKKVLVRGVIVLLLLLISSSFYWFFVVKKPAEEEVVPPTEEESIPPEEGVIEKPEIIISPSLLSITETRTLEISKNEEIPESFNRLMAEELQKGEFLRVVIKNIDENRLASLEDLFGAFQIEASEGISKKLEADYTLAIYPQEQGKRIVFVAKIGEKEELTELLKNWEEKIAKEGFFVSGNKVPTLLSYFKTSSYQNVSFRYLTISKEDFGICYLLFDNYFVFATSFESLKKAIEQVKQEVELSALREKVGQLFIVGFEGKEISPQLEEFIKKYKPGGVLLLSKNIESQEQLKNLISGLQEISLKETGLPLFIAVDQEGKSLARIGFLSEKTDQSEIKNTDEAYQVGLKRGEELKELGVNLNLAPVLDIASSGDFLFARSFQKPAGETGELAKSLISGQKAAGILTAMKHFPGYDGISSSPEEELGTLSKVPEISQFKKAAEANPEIIMTSNLIYQQIDSSLPFPLSAKAIRYLKDILGQKILTASDDLDQNSLLEKFSLKDIVKKPVEAGVDILIFSGYRLPAEKGLDEALQAAKNKEISLEKIDKAFLRITQLKKALLK